MKQKLVPSGWLEREGRRLDCGPYLSGAMEAKVLLERLPVPRADLCSLRTGTRAASSSGSNSPGITFPIPLTASRSCRAAPCCTRTSPTPIF